MASYISPDDFRIKGEKTALYLGFGIVIAILLFITAVSVGLVTIVVVAATATLVWIQQSQLLGQAARVSKDQFPEIHEIAEDAANRLDMHQPEVFVRYNPTINAFAIGFLGRKSVVLHSAVVEAMEKNELKHIIGHEFAHIKCGHTNLTVLTSSSQGINVPVISQILGFIFLFWSRKAEYTCDRGGLIAGRDLKSSVSAMCKLAVGPVLFQQMNIGDFLDQQKALDQNDIANFSEAFATHPYLVKRIHAMQHYFESPEFKNLTGKKGYA
jgi:Zn-dependent protease with chaperone function